MSFVVLAVDDEPLLLDVLCAMLADLGCEAVYVDCPVRKDLCRRAIAMLITDIQMPIMDCFELANRAREKRPDMPIVLMSGRELGRPGFPVIRKPFSLRNWPRSCPDCPVGRISTGSQRSLLGIVLRLGLVKGLPSNQWTRSRPTVI